MAFAIHHRRSTDSHNEYNLIRDGIATLDEAREARSVSGDLVVFSKSKIVVNDPGWLFEWELREPNCYAQRARKSGKTLSEMTQHREVFSRKAA